MDIDGWLTDPDERIVHVEFDPARPPLFDDVDPPLGTALEERLATLGIERLYRHQAAAIRSLRAGTSTVVVAGTASGKSLGFQIPISEAIEADPNTTALAIYPTKALAHDQLRSFALVGGPGIHAATYDGDTPTQDRPMIRRSADIILTNPDMLHAAMLPYHGNWAAFLANLRYVVVDEIHALKGIFGSHTALVLRRLRRLANHYGADPVFAFTSATIGNPGELAGRLSGLDVHVIDQDTSATGDRTIALWNPELIDPEHGVRASAVAEASEIFARLVAEGRHTIAFARSRRASELMYRWARDRLDTETGKRIAPYRAGYLAEDRRKTERGLSDGTLLGVTATNALELGIDVGGLDAAIITTFPGTISSFRQQLGRAGRRQEASLAVLVAGVDALDQYYMTHPDQLFSRSAEAAVVNPENETILDAHIGCAAYELPIVPDDRSFLGPTLEDRLPHLMEDGNFRIREGKLFWASRVRPTRHVNLRTSGSAPYDIVEIRGDALGSIDEHRAFSQCHAGAVYLHRGESYLVEALDLANREVRVRRKDVDYYTQAHVEKDLIVTRTEETKRVGRLDVGVGRVEVESHVIGFKKKKMNGGATLDTLPLDLPTERFGTEAFWFEFPDELYEEAGLEWQAIPGTLHAIEHTAIAMLPMYAICDRWDVGGLSTAMHRDVGRGVFFIYDGYPGGAGIAPIGFSVAERHLRATLDAVRTCPCAAGCPSCVQSPKCGNFNDPLDKAGAIALLAIAVDD